MDPTAPSLQPCQSPYEVVINVEISKALVFAEAKTDQIVAYGSLNTYMVRVI